MTLTLTKTVVEQNWTTKQIQENIARVHGLLFFNAISTISKFGPEAVTTFETEMRTHKVEHFKSLGIKTPIELVKAMAEFDTNVFGSKVEIWGDEKQAHIQYLSCAMWNAMKNVAHLTEKQEQEMGGKMEACTQMFAKEFGFKAEMKKEGEGMIVTYTK